MSEQQSYEIQQQHTQRPAPGKEGSHATIQAESCSSEKGEGLNVSLPCALAAKVTNNMLVVIEAQSLDQGK